MNFALLGDDPAILPLIRACAIRGGHLVPCGALVGGLEHELLRIAPALRILAGWDQILTVGGVDAVLVCGASEAILEAARQLAAAGKKLVILPRSDQGSTWIYELGLIRDEGQTTLIPLFIDRILPAFHALRETIHSGALGRILYLRIDREIASNQAGGGPALLSRYEIENALLHDVDILRNLAGDYSRVSAVHSGVVGEQIAAVGVTLLGDNLPEATWSTSGTTGTPQWKLVVAGEKREVAVTAAGATPEWAIQTEGIELPQLPADAPSDAGSLILRSLEDPNGSGAADWNDLVRAFEIVDASQISVRRRRAIDLHFETTSERNIFKSKMTAVGCLVLTFTLFAIVFLLVVMPLLDVRGRAQVEAQRVGSIVRATEFAPNGANLEAAGTAHVDRLAERLGGTRVSVLIEESRGTDARKLDERRRATVVGLLTRQGVKDAADRTQIAPVVGEWYPAVLRVVRILAFTPLAVFLALQVLVLLTRPATK